MVTTDRAFWAGKRVLLTGHTGFKGSWLALWLQRLGADVAGVALDPPTDPSLFECAGVGGGMTDLRRDIRDARAVKDALAQTSPEIVIHMAAQSLVRSAYDAPADTFATNVMGTVNVLEAVRLHGQVRAVVVVSSDKCYENRGWLRPYRETDAMGGHDPYSSSKGCVELVASSYRRSFPEQCAMIATARAGNVIGGGDWALDRLVPDAIRAFISKEPLRLRNPQAVRPWQHVLEPLSGYLTLARRLHEREASLAEGWNFGPSEPPTAVEAVVERLAHLWGNGASWMCEDVSHRHEAQRLNLDSHKAIESLGWWPRLSLDEALDWTIQWYRQWAEGRPMRAETEKQIEHYGSIERQHSLVATP